MAAISPSEATGTQADDRNERLASLLLEVARAIDPDVATVLPRQLDVDPRLDAVKSVLLRQEPDTLVNILYPVMGPAIRKAIAESMNDKLQGLNQALRYAFTLRGLRWRLEALRSGTTFGDVVLKHTLVFRVEHVFLIHRKSGLLLEHIAAEDATARDPHLVSGMLTAIQDFVRDSFDDPSAVEGGAIDSLRLGDLLLWCEAGPQAYLAAVIRG